MPPIAIYELSPTQGELRMGEILSGVAQYTIDPSSIGQADLRFRVINHENVIVISQDCDLPQHFEALNTSGDTTSQISSILFCELHPDDVLRKTRSINSDTHKQVRQNKHERYEFLEKVPQDQDSLGIGFPNLLIDFRRHFSIPADEVYEQLRQQAKRRCRLVTPYAEHLVLRFCNYQSRIALPRDHDPKIV